MKTIYPYDLKTGRPGGATTPKLDLALLAAAFISLWIPLWISLSAPPVPDWLAEACRWLGKLNLLPALLILVAGLLCFFSQRRWGWLGFKSLAEIFVAFMRDERLVFIFEELEFQGDAPLAAGGLSRGEQEERRRNLVRLKFCLWISSPASRAATGLILAGSLCMPLSALADGHARTAMAAAGFGLFILGELRLFWTGFRSL